MRLRYLLLSFTLFICAGLFAQNRVTLYENCNYSGRYQYLEPGNYRTYQLGISNDNLSSIRVPYGMKITIYVHDKYQGGSRTFTSDISCLDSGWNNITSSVVVEGQPYGPGNNGGDDYVTFYSDCYSKGYAQSLRPGVYSGAQLGSLKYNISSLSINGNLRVKVYLNSEYNSGYAYNIDNSQSCLPGSYNDKIASLSIEYRSNNYPNNYPNNGNNYATVYTDCGYRGNSLRLAPGYYQGDKLGLLKYDISAIEIPSNLRAKVYVNNENLNGSYYTLTENSSCLSSTLNNRIGSLVIEETSGNGYPGNNPGNNNQRVVLYVDANYRGQSASLLPGKYATMTEAGFIDNALSSLTVPAGYRAVLYEFENFGGKTYTVTADKSGFILSNWNDKCSSIIIYRDR